MTQPGYSSSYIFPHSWSINHKVQSSVRDDPLVPDQTHSTPIKHWSSGFILIMAFIIKVTAEMGVKDEIEIEKYIRDYLLFPSLQKYIVVECGKYCIVLPKKEIS